MKRDVITGLDQFLPQKDRIVRKKIGLLTNYAGVTATGETNIRALQRLEPESLTVFAPEHGYWGDVQYMERPEDRTYRGVRVRSLYEGESGHALFPEPAEIADLDLLLVDLQDVGTRYYTYYASMLNAMHVAAAVRTHVIVLDRPNPLNGVTIEGPSLKPPFVSFVGQYPIPVRHGLTIGELALYLNETQGIGCRLEVIRMTGWERTMWWDDTTLRWVNPSPNMPTIDTALVYPGTCLFEATNVSEGRGITRPFEVFGAPWLDKFALADALNSLDLPGVWFEPFSFIPGFGKFKGEHCDGARIVVLDREVFRPMRTGVWCLAKVREMRPSDFQWNRAAYEWANCSAIDALTGSISLRAILDTERGDLDAWINSWSHDEGEFRTRCAPYLLYRTPVGAPMHVPPDGPQPPSAMLFPPAA